MCVPADDAEPLFDEALFTSELKKLVAWAQGTGAKRVILPLPIPYPFGSTEHTTSTLVLPATQAVAAELGLETIDLHSPFAG